MPTDDYGVHHPSFAEQQIRILRTLARALATGFVVYLVIVAGLLVVTGTPFAMDGPDDYARLTGTLSLFSFVLALRPRLFFGILDRLKQTLAHPAPQELPAATAPVPHVAPLAETKPMGSKSAPAPAIPGS